MEQISILIPLSRYNWSDQKELLDLEVSRVTTTRDLYKWRLLVNFKRFGFMLLCFVILLLASSCDLLSSLLGMSEDLSVEMHLDKSTYEYDETINVTLNIESDPNRDITVSWKVNGADPTFIIADPKSFSFSLRPSVTTSYTLEATVSDGKDTIKKSYTFDVKQFVLVGTWKTVNVLNPGYIARKDIVGIWKIGRFEIYYFDANGGTQIRTYSARGAMDFPTENTWVKLTQEEYYDESTSSWETGTGNMWVKYALSTDKLSVTIELDMTAPANAAEYTWVFTKVDNTIDSWY